jgi:hypothetical protein
MRVNSGPEVIVLTVRFFESKSFVEGIILFVVGVQCFWVVLSHSIVDVIGQVFIIAAGSKVDVFNLECH